MTYHVLTPLRRYENLEKLITMLHLQREPSGTEIVGDGKKWKLDIRWHILMDEDAPFHLFFKQDWIHVYRQENTELEFWKRCNLSINRWLDTHHLFESDKYCILNDDDAYMDGFFQKLDQHVGGLLIASMKRGDHTPAGVSPTRAHATNTLVAAPENMKVGHVGVEQFFICGKWLKDARLPLTVAGDGEMVSYLVAAHGATYVPDAYVLFNRFEPGRWD